MKRYVVSPPGSLVSASSQRYATCSLACNNVYNCTELLEQISSLCDWSSMVQLGNSSQHMRMVVQDVVRRRISKCLDRFIPRKHHARFFELLESTEAAVVGGFIRHIMCLEEDVYRFVFPTQLSLLIPIGRFGDSDTGRRWVHFISNCGDYGATCDNDTSLPYSRTSSSTNFFNQMSSVRGHFSSPEVGAKNPVSSMFRYHLWSARTTTLYQPSYPHQKRHCLMS